jgi:hypothetical protein
LSEIDPNWDPWGQTEPLQAVPWGQSELRVGDRVRLQPKGSADIMDLALAGKTATVQAIEQDYDDLLRQPGHRFFFRLEEVTPA